MSRLSWKIYLNGNHIASAARPFDAACLAGVSKGRVIRFKDGPVVWREGREQYSARTSPGRATDLMLARATDSGAARRKRQEITEAEYLEEMRDLAGYAMCGGQ